MKEIDLHVHTTASDGNFSPRRVIDLAIRKGIKIVAITDHNSVGSLEISLEYSKDKNIKIIPGIEISCSDGELNIHVLGLFIDFKNERLVNLLKKKEKFLPEVIDVIKKSGGLAILSHPGIYLNKMERVISKFVEFGGSGIEIYYPYDKIYEFSLKRKKEIVEKLEKIARDKNLLATGGSDFHGSNRNVEIGEGGLNYQDFENLKKKANQ